jgi:hypothetical protein
MSAQPSFSPRLLTFVQDGKPSAVDLDAPMAERRGSRWMVRLMDLWVATLLPGDIFDLSFKIRAFDLADGRRRVARVDGLVFARGFLVTATRELWWENEAEGVLAGSRIYAVEVCTAVDAPTAAPETAWRPGPASVATIHRLLPLTRVAYPPVEWRSVTPPLE